MSELVVEAHAADPPRTRPLPLRAWGVLAGTAASTGLFALVVNLVHLGFAHKWADPVGYVVAILEPFALTMPGYLVLRVVLGWGRLEDEIEAITEALKNASLTIACYAPVIWFYLLTSPTPTFPTIAFSFGAIAFWLPLLWDLARRSRRVADRWREVAVTWAWLGLMFWAEARMLIGWLASGLAGRFS